MSATPAAAETQTPAPDEAAALVAQGLAQLSELAQIGMTFARALGRIAQDAVEQANGETPEPTPALNDAALAFSRVSRAVRMTVGLQAKIVRDRQARADRIATEKAVKDAEDARVLEERRVKANMRRAVTRYVVQTAIEAEERDADETDRLFEGLDARLHEIGDDPLDFEEIHVKDTAYAIARDLGVDPGPDWWQEGWQYSPPPRNPSPERGRMGPVAKQREDGVTDLSGSGAASAPPPQTPRSG
jgi:hypothetical protein